MKQETLEIAVPKDVNVKVAGTMVEMSSAGKQNKRNFVMRGFAVEQKAGTIVLRAISSRKNVYASMKATAAHIENMVIGVKRGYEYKMEVVYSHFPINVSLKGNVLEISNLIGCKAPIKVPIVGQTKVEIKGKEITAKGVDKEEVGQTCANIENATRILKKDRRVFQDGIYIVKKDMPKLAEIIK